MKNLIILSKKSSIINKIIFAVSLCIFLYSSAVLIRRGIETYKTKEINAELEEIYAEITAPEEESIDYETPDNSYDYEELDEKDKSGALQAANKAALEKRKLEEQRKVEQIKKQVPKLLKINSDIKGWIRIENTEVSNPIVQTVDNTFYLDHDVTKKENRHGSIFVDAENDLSSPAKLQGQNIILYGHHMKDRTMFGSLKYFRDDNFFIINDIINLDIFPNSYKFKIFGVYLVGGDFDYRDVKLGTKNDIKSFLKRMHSKNIQYREVTLYPKDTLLTLSTCEYDFTDARLVVLAKLIREDTSKK